MQLRATSEITGQAGKEILKKRYYWSYEWYQQAQPANEEASVRTGCC